MRGYFITFEGIEGSGKSTQIANLAAFLEQKGWNVLITREPGGTKVGEKIRELLLDVPHQDIALKTELLLYLASRAQHLHEVIVPALKQGKVVLCDRFSEATLAYQGYGRDLGIDKIKALVKYVTDRLKPDLTLLLDVDVRRGLERIHTRPAKNRLDLERIQFYEKVRQGYLKLARMNPKQIVVIDANRDFQIVAQQIQRVVERFLKRHGVQRRHRA